MINELVLTIPPLAYVFLGAVLGGAYFTVGLRLSARTGRAWWAAGLVAAAALHVVFAFGSGAGAVGLQLIGVAVFAAVARAGMSGRTGWLAAGWLLHPAWDWALGGTSPEGYVWMCFGFDLVVGAALYLRSVRR